MALKKHTTMHKFSDSSSPDILRWSGRKVVAEEKAGRLTAEHRAILAKQKAKHIKEIEDDAAKKKSLWADLAGKLGFKNYDYLNPDHVDTLQAIIRDCLPPSVEDMYEEMTPRQLRMCVDGAILKKQSFTTKPDYTPAFSWKQWAKWLGHEDARTAQVDIGHAIHPDDATPKGAGKGRAKRKVRIDRAKLPRETAEKLTEKMNGRIR